jgi:hypothetical protein
LLIEIYPFDKARVRNTFECGRRPIDAWYKNKAKKCAERLEFAVFEAILNGSVVGYYALQVGSESLSALENKPDDYTKNYTAFPAVHLAFLGYTINSREKELVQLFLAMYLTELLKFLSTQASMHLHCNL